jgi:hypothetical protein
LSASFRIKGTGLISLFIGEKPDTIAPGSILIGNGRAAMDRAAAARMAAGRVSRNAKACWRIRAFRSETNVSAAFMYRASMLSQKLIIKDVNGRDKPGHSRERCHQ